MTDSGEASASVVTTTDSGPASRILSGAPGRRAGAVRPRPHYGDRMALLHEATITPRKDELVEPWLRTRPWWDGEAERGPVAAFRLDDPAGEVGIECFLMGSPSGSTLFVPVTYRGAALDGAGLVGTLEHSVLGTRYVYDACTDPVFVATVLDTVRAGGRQADLHLVLADGAQVVREPAATARGDGDPAVPVHDPAQPLAVVDGADRTTVTGPGWELVVMRRAGDAPAGPALVAGYAGGVDLRVAVVRPGQ